MMSKNKLPEVWMRGPLPGVPPLLQPVAHALLQAREEVTGIMTDFPESLLWHKAGNMASPGFHLQHISGVIDRLFTYAKAEMLAPEQLQYLGNEGKPLPDITITDLLDQLSHKIDQAVSQLKSTDERTLTDFRGVGRRQLPSTVMGLLFHAAEHTMRHTGQLLVTVNVLKQSVTGG